MTECRYIISGDLCTLPNTQKVVDFQSLPYNRLLCSSHISMRKVSQISCKSRRGPVVNPSLCTLIASHAGGHRIGRRHGHFRASAVFVSNHLFITFLECRVVHFSVSCFTSRKMSDCFLIEKYVKEIQYY